MKIRRAVIGDIDAMHRVRTSVRENRLADPGRVRPEDYRAMLEEHGRGWVAEVEGRIAGFAIADRTRANVWALFVDPLREGEGIGRSLHEVMLDWLFSTDVERAWLGTEPGTRAERFYRANGWEQTAGGENGELRFEQTRERWESRRSG